jgi:CheY-like chemotaxis protein
LRAGNKPDVILLDIVMPYMDGLELLKTIRTENLAPDAIVVMLTNQSQSSDIERAKELKVDGYIVKASTIPSEVLHEVEKIYEAKKGNK